MNFSKLTKDEVKIIRKLVFTEHARAGHVVYYDDGERQCNTCLIDFKRDSLEEIERKTHARRAKGA